MHDVTIIGGGPAGMTAAIYAARKNIDFIIISPDVGGQAAWAPEVENYLGFTLISGLDLARKFEEHVKQFDVRIVDDRVRSLEKFDGTFQVTVGSGNRHASRSVIVASGRSARNMGVPGEAEYMGKGIAYCATCEAPLFAGEDVAVVGGGNAGLSAAAQLSKIANKVYLIEELPRLTGDAAFHRRIKAADNVTVLTNTEVKEVTGNRMVEGLSIRNFGSQEVRKIPVTGVFVEIGSLPNVGFLPEEVALTEYGEVKIDCLNRTSLAGLYAAGDVSSVPHKQIIIAAGEGAKALLSAHEYVIRNFPDGG